jgi:hypothetical protein
MNFETLKAAIVDLLGNAAAGRFRVIGYQKQAQSAENVKDLDRSVQVFYKQGVFPKSAGSINGPVQHDMVFHIILTVSSASKGNLAALDNPNSTVADLKYALEHLKLAEENADALFDSLARIVFQILMDARNIDLGLEPVRVGGRWVETIVKDEVLIRGALVVQTGALRLTARMPEELLGDSVEHDLEVIDAGLEVEGDSTVQAGIIYEYEE